MTGDSGGGSGGGGGVVVVVGGGRDVQKVGESMKFVSASCYECKEN